MKKKINIAILLILGISTNIFACLMASQERIIPIGTSENCLIAIEIISHRYSDGEFGSEIVWNYDISLKGYNQDYSDYLIEKLDSKSKLMEEDIDQLLQSQIKKAVRITSKLNNFNVFKAKNIKFCDFQQKCSDLELINTKTTMVIKDLSNKSTHPIKFLNKDCLSKVGKSYREYFNFYFEESKIIGLDLKISSIRRYYNYKHSLLIFHLGTGQEFEEIDTNKYPEKKEYNFNKVVNSLEDVIFIEPILHHGKGFDYFVVN